MSESVGRARHERELRGPLPVLTNVRVRATPWIDESHDRTNTWHDRRDMTPRVMFFAGVRIVSEAHRDLLRDSLFQPMVESLA